MHPDTPTQTELEAIEPQLVTRTNPWPYAPQYCNCCGKMRIIPSNQSFCVVCLGLLPDKD